MDTKKLKESLTTEDIIKLCTHLQGDDCYLYDSQGHPIFSTALCHGGDSQKLYYYPETGLFHCYTCGASYDVLGLVQRARGCEFREALEFIVDFFHVSTWRDSPGDEAPELEDWDIFQKVDDYAEAPETPETVVEGAIPESMLEYYYRAAPLEWQKDGISPEVMDAYGIRVDAALHHIIIPHRDEHGALIGIRRRSFNPIEVADGKKYMPSIIQKTVYRHNLGDHLYGLYQNRNTISALRKAFVAESEKSVLQLATMYGTDQCWAVATCGSSFSRKQMDLLLGCGVVEVVLGFDHEFTGRRGEADAMAYEAKLIKIVKPLLPYVDVSLIMDYDGLTQLKDSPTDRGKDVFEKLYHQRIRVSSLDEVNPGSTRRKA